MEKLTKDLFKDEKIGTSKNTQAGARCYATSIGGTVTHVCSVWPNPDPTDIGQ